MPTPRRKKTFMPFKFIFLSQPDASESHNHLICWNGSINIEWPRNEPATWVLSWNYSRKHNFTQRAPGCQGEGGKNFHWTHLTLILKAGGILNIGEELKVGYRSEKAFAIEEQLPNPKKSKTKEAKDYRRQNHNSAHTIPAEEDRHSTWSTDSYTSLLGISTTYSNLIRITKKSCSRDH